MKYKPTPRTLEAVEFILDEEGEVAFTEKPDWLVDAVLTGRVKVGNGTVTVSSSTSHATAEEGYITNSLRLYDAMAFEALYEPAGEEK